MKNQTKVKLEKSINNLKTYFKEHNHVPTREFSKQNSLLLVGFTTISRQYGGWNNFLQSIDLPVPRPIEGVKGIYPCQQCGKDVRVLAYRYKNSETKNFFCSQSCAATFNNQLTPKRKAKRHFCQTCGVEVKKRRKTCDECKRKDLEEKPIKELLYKKGTNRHNHIRGRARTIYYSYAPRECLVCGYKHHIEVCHIIPVSAFPEDTKIKDVNSRANLIGLCRNCHWELDHDIISIVLIE